MSGHIVELRHYRCMPGRLPDVILRFREIVLPLWKERGISVTGFWITEVGDSNHDLYYMLRWSSMAEREAKWTAWVTDATWLQRRGETEKNGPLVQSVQNQFLKPVSL